MLKFLRVHQPSVLPALALKDWKYSEAHLKNEAWVFSAAGQQNEDAMGQMKFPPN